MPNSSIIVPALFGIPDDGSILSDTNFNIDFAFCKSDSSSLILACSKISDEQILTLSSGIIH